MPTLMNRERDLMFLSFALLISAFLADVITPQALVIAILYNVPIALSSLAPRRWAPLAMAGLALAGNVAAGILNAAAVPLDTTAVVNRALAAASFLLVGLLAVALRGAMERATKLELEGVRLRREEDLRQLLQELGAPLPERELLAKVPAALRSLLDARNVTLVGASGGRFTVPRVGHPDVAASLQLGDRLPWPALAVIEEDEHETAVFGAREYEGAVLAGRVQRDARPALVVWADGPGHADAKLRLREAIRVLEPILERAALIEALQDRQALLERRNTVIRDLIYAFSHDMRTPLMANAMTMRLALEGAYGALGSEYRETLEHGLEANRALLDLADELLLVARHETGEALPERQAADLAALVRDEAARQRALFEGKAVELEVHAPRELRALVRSGDIRRVLQNLLSNAAAFAPTGSTVTVTLEHDDDTSREGALLVVEDEGAGVAPAQRGRLFQRFSTGRAGGGMGLGLYLAKQIVDAHGGRIRYDPREPCGSRFTAWLPLVDEAVTA